MNKIEEKIKALLSERETLIDELTGIKNAFDVRQQRLIEIAGSINTLQELLNEEKDDSNKENNENTTKK